MEELHEYQNKNLRNIIKIAYENVPFYKKIFKEKRLTPGDVKTIKDLQKLPIIDKHSVRDNFKDFKNESYRGLVFKGLTSGYTGTPGVFLRDMHLGVLQKRLKTHISPNIYYIMKKVPHLILSVPPQGNFRQ